jgi:hypothetical protein
MRPCLESCPDLIIELVTASLELGDIQNLRLAAKALSEKASGGRFRRLCESKHVDVSVDALQAFISGLQSCSVLLPVKRLWLTGLFPTQSEPLRQKEKELGLLVEAFNEMVKHSGGAALESLTLRVAVIGEDDARSLPVEVIDSTIQKRMLTCAVETWQSTLRALTASQLPVGKLNAFNDTDMQQCGLPYHHIWLNRSQHKDLAASLKPLTFLSLSFCRSKLDNDDDIEGKFFDDVTKLVSLCPDLNHIELHYFLGGYSLSRAHSDTIFHRMLDLGTLPRLTRCILRGISSDEEDLLRFIKETKPSHLSLETVNLRSGTFAPIIDYCTSDEADIKSLLFDTLYEKEDTEHRMVQFHGRQDSQASLQGGSERLVRDQDSIKQPTSFFVSPPFFIGSPMTADYTRRQQLEYG